MSIELVELVRSSLLALVYRYSYLLLTTDAECNVRMNESVSRAGLAAA
jgi:hypothetical protein